jgi:hypothetical protein
MKLKMLFMFQSRSFEVEILLNTILDDRYIRRLSLMVHLLMRPLRIAPNNLNKGRRIL